MKKLIIRALIAILIVFLVVFFARKQTQGDQFRNLKSLNIEDTSLYKYTYDIKSNTKENSFCYQESEKCDKKEKTIKVETDNIEVLDNYKKEYLFYRDNNKLKMYSSDNEKTYLINMPDKFSNYTFVIINGSLAGIIYEDNKLDGFYSIKLNKHLYTHKYNNINVVSENYLSGSLYDDNNINEGKQIKEELLDINTEKVLLSKEIKDSSEFNSYYFKKVNNNIVLVSTSLNDQIYKEVYDKNLKLLFKTDKNESYTVDGESFDFVYGLDVVKDNFYVYEDMYFTKYDNNGKVVKKSNKLEDVVMQVNEYVVIQNENISLMDIDNKETLITEYTPSMLLRVELSGYDEKENAIHFVIEEDDLDASKLYNECKSISTCKYKETDFKDGILGYDYYYYLKTKKVVKVPTILPSDDNPAL